MAAGGGPSRDPADNAGADGALPGGDRRGDGSDEEAVVHQEILEPEHPAPGPARGSFARPRRQRAAVVDAVDVEQHEPIGIDRCRFRAGTAAIDERLLRVAPVPCVLDAGAILEADRHANATPAFIQPDAGRARARELTVAEACDDDAGVEAAC